MSRPNVSGGAVSRPNVYAGGWLDRAAHRRGDALWLAEAQGQARFLPLVGLKVAAIAADSSTPTPLHLDRAALGAVEPAALLFLGVEKGESWFAWMMPHAEDAATALLRGHDPAVSLVDLRGVGPRLDAAAAHRLAFARGLAAWHAGHRFCARCGSPTESLQGGHQRRCLNPACAALHFPRMDPAIIVLVDDGAGACLLGRQKSWPAGMFSTLAGFVEPGESIEDAVHREVGEETGVPVTAIRYHSSQPWPFPQSLMFGFRARATGRRIRLDVEEMDDARWFTASMVRAPEAHGFSLPRGDSIARRLIIDWLAELDGV